MSKVGGVTRAGEFSTVGIRDEAPLVIWAEEDVPEIVRVTNITVNFKSRLDWRFICWTYHGSKIFCSKCRQLSVYAHKLVHPTWNHGSCPFFKTGPWLSLPLSLSLSLSVETEIVNWWLVIHEVLPDLYSILTLEEEWLWGRKGMSRDLAW